MTWASSSLGHVCPLRPLSRACHCRVPAAGAPQAKRRHRNIAVPRNEGPPIDFVQAGWGKGRGHALLQQAGAAPEPPAPSMPRASRLNDPGPGPRPCYTAASPRAARPLPPPSQPPASGRLGDLPAAFVFLNHAPSSRPDQSAHGQAAATNSSTPRGFLNGRCPPIVASASSPALPPPRTGSNESPSPRPRLPSSPARDLTSAGDITGHGGQWATRRRRGA